MTRRFDHLPAAAWSAALLVVALFGSPGRADAQLSKGNRLLINRGVELQGLVQWADFFNLTTYSNANYTSINFGGQSAPALLGPTPGFPWGRWASSPSDMPPEMEQGDSPDETPYLSQLVNLELADELNLNDGPTRTNEINWINSLRTNFPNTILYINNYGGQASDSTLSDILAKGPPDMLCFDMYPFTSVYDTNSPNNIGAPLGGPFNSWLSELRRYRAWGIAGNIPFGTYMQTFHSVEDYDSRVYRYPSPSEMRFNNFAALAFNAKELIGFVYNAGATVLFNILPNGYSGDTYTNSLYVEQVDINHRAVNLGKSLACLKPVYDMHNTNDSPAPPGPGSANANFPDGTTTSVLILKGNPGSTNPAYPPTAEPIGFVDNPAAPKSYSWWEFQKNDPYLNGWAVSNKGTNNGGFAGQVIISWFNVLDESLDGPTYSNEVYLMVVNALTATNGTAADCLQEIKLNFQTGTNPITAVDLLDPESGLVTTTNMPVIAGSGNTTKRQLVLDLNGGDAVLFKFSDGAPFVGHVHPGAAHLTTNMQGGHPSITIQGTPLARYCLQSAPAPFGAGWTTISSVLLTNSTATILDTSTYSGQSTYYRAVGVP